MDKQYEELLIFSDLLHLLRLSNIMKRQNDYNTNNNLTYEKEIFLYEDFISKLYKIHSVVEYN